MSGDVDGGVSGTISSGMSGSVNGGWQEGVKNTIVLMIITGMYVQGQTETP